MARKQDNHPAQLARLFGKRLVVCVETHEGARLDEGLVKELTGGDPVTARRMREDPWQFNPTHKAILITNHKPQITGTDDGIWRRQRLIPFTVRIPDDRQDKGLADKLRQELPGILAWLVGGCLEWQREGLEPPEEVKAATQQYRSENDLLMGFIGEQCFQGREYRCRANEFYARFRKWCEEGGEARASEIPSQRKVGEKLAEQLSANGFEKKTSNGTWYVGLALRPGNDEPLPD
jgi:putative DNA primase/helicase